MLHCTGDGVGGEVAVGVTRACKSSRDRVRGGERCDWGSAFPPPPPPTLVFGTNEVRFDHVKAPLRVSERVKRPVAGGREGAAGAAALVAGARQVRNVRVDAGLQALAVEIVGEVREAVGELDRVGLHDVRHRVARAGLNDALLNEHVRVALVPQARRHEGVRDLAEEGVVVVAAEEVPCRRGRRTGDRRGDVSRAAVVGGVGRARA